MKRKIKLCGIIVVITVMFIVFAGCKHSVNPVHSHNYQWVYDADTSIETEVCSGDPLHTRGMRLKDDRDGQIYKIVKIGNQVWMAENLNFDAPGSRYYDDDQAANEQYGRMYGFDIMLNGEEPSTGNPSGVQGIAPKGWHLPSEAEWLELIETAGGDTVAGKKLKATSGWDNNGNGTDEYGFTALPGGTHAAKSGFNGSFDHKGTLIRWYSTSLLPGAIAHNGIAGKVMAVDDHIWLSDTDNPDAVAYVRCVLGSDPAGPEQGKGLVAHYWVNEQDVLAVTAGGAYSIAPGNTLTITAQGTGYTVVRWDLNGTDTGKTGTSYNFSANILGTYTVGLIVKKGGKYYNANFAITVQ